MRAISLALSLLVTSETVIGGPVEVHGERFVWRKIDVEGGKKTREEGVGKIDRS